MLQKNQWVRYHIPCAEWQSPPSSLNKNGWCVWISSETHIIFFSSKLVTINWFLSIILKKKSVLRNKPSVQPKLQIKLNYKLQFANISNFISSFRSELGYYCVLKCGFAGCETSLALDLFYKWFFDSKWARNWKLVSVYFYVVSQIGQFCNLVKRVTVSSHPRVYFLHCLVD